MRKLLAAGAALLTMLFAGCSSAAPAAQTVTSTARTTISTTRLLTVISTATETPDTETVSVPTTERVTVTYDPVAASKSKAAASSKASAEAAQKNGVEGYRAQIKAAGIGPEVESMTGGLIDISDPLTACKRLRAGTEPFDDLGITIDWNTYWSLAKKDERTALKLLVKNVCPELQSKLDAAEKDVTQQQQNAGKLVYTVSGEGTAMITFTDAQGQISQQSDASLPWSKALEGVGSDDFISVSAQHSTGGGKISCAIEYEGEQVTSNESSGDYAIVQCSK
ncbi:MmpS family transport accessory protein [Nakamurella aerolata]|uniref:Uncharacterized protein n=1 Tax=Nakamurella aerolata TaxID=1656892 RepID=A0A849A8L2_9ACTN|nr:MmpS family transport accessory protein [Nakamurella aerolata]NNG36899.1 hypothetical protein [Nakamurella aerolata]